MAYAVVADVASEFKDIEFASGTTVTDTEVTEFITQAEALINSFVAKRYQLPITLVDNPDSFSILKWCSVTLVAERVRAIMEVKETAEEVTQGGRRKTPADKVKDKLKAISVGDIELHDADKISSGSGVGSFSAACDDPFTFERGKDQW